jgi:hypothetical protein
MELFGNQSPVAPMSTDEIISGRNIEDQSVKDFLLACFDDEAEVGEHYWSVERQKLEP